MSWENVIAGEGLGLSLTGMFIVFSGLTLISLFIASIPRIFEWAGIAQSQLQRPRVQAADAANMEREPMVWEDEELLAAIGCVLQQEAEHLRASDAQRITIRRDDAQRNWAIVGKMRTLSTRM